MVKYSVCRLLVTLMQTQIQAVNDADNLIFFVFFLTILVCAIVLVYRKVRGRSVKTLMIAMLSYSAAYIAVLAGVSLASQTQSLALGTDECFDDWCATVIGAQTVAAHGTTPGKKSVGVTLGISNRARQVAFRPSQPRVALMLESGEFIAPSAAAQRDFEKNAGSQESLAKRIVAGERFQTVVMFDVPVSMRRATVVVLEGPAIVTRFLVGDENSFLHKKLVFPIAFE